MSSRSLTTVVTADTIALNAAVFGYAGHSIVTPQHAIQQIWWTEERIQAKVTRDFINSKLKPEERRRLEQPVSFGSDLTDYKYIDWILSKAKRFFLILVEIGAPDQIFRIIDDIWDDEDLPIPAEDLPNLILSWKTDEILNRKFYSTQFTFLLRPLTQDAHINYGINEVVPIEYVHRLTPAAALQSWLKMHLPKKPHEIYVRRKVNLGNADKPDPKLEADFLADVHKSRLVQHKHVAPVFASYTVKGTGYYVTTFEAEHTLKSFIEFRSAASLNKLTKSQRNGIVMTWCHCLADALASIHEAGQHHSAISPSNIVVDGKNQIAFSDIGSLKSFQGDKKIADPSEIYNYSAPEHTAFRSLAFLNKPNDGTNFSRLGHRRKPSTDSRRSSATKSRQSSHSSGNSLTSLAEIAPGLTSVGTPSVSSLASIEGPQTPPSETSPISAIAPPPPPKDDVIVPNRIAIAETVSLYNGKWAAEPSPPPSPKPSIQSNATGTTITATNTQHTRQQADVFSLGCVFLDMLTYLIKKKHNEFAKYRTTKRRPDNYPPTPTSGPPTSPQSPGNSKFDASFHNNLGKVLDWTTILDSDAALLEDPTYRAIPQFIRLIRCMLSSNPLLRPSGAEVRERIFDILISHAGIQNVCCHSGHSLAMGVIRIAPPPPTPIQSTIPILQPPPMPQEISPKSRAPSPSRSIRNKKSLGILVSINEKDVLPPQSPTPQGGFTGFFRGVRWNRRVS